MSDSMMNLFQGGREDAPKSPRCFSVAEKEALAIEFRMADGVRSALAYCHLYEVQYAPAKDGEPEKILLNFPDLTHVEIRGRNLLELYGALVLGKVDWVTEASANEVHGDMAASIDRIAYFSLKDWELDFSDLEDRRIEWQTKYSRNHQP